MDAWKWMWLGKWWRTRRVAGGLDTELSMGVMIDGESKTRDKKRVRVLDRKWIQEWRHGTESKLT